jgi:hypothetical protein
MASSHVTSSRDRERICALTVGLAATVIAWTFAAAFAPEQLESLGRYSPWIYGPASTVAWALFSVIAYLLVSRGRRMAPQNLHEGYRCRELGIRAPANGCSMCANRREKNRLEAVTAGFAFTISTWVGMLSFMPEGWLERLGQAQSWVYCVVSVVLWVAFSGVMYLVFHKYDSET